MFFQGFVADDKIETVMYFAGETTYFRCGQVRRPVGFLPVPLLSAPTLGVGQAPPLSWSLSKSLWLLEQQPSLWMETHSLCPGGCVTVTLGVLHGQLPWPPHSPRVASWLSAV